MQPLICANTAIPFSPCITVAGIPLTTHHTDSSNQSTKLDTVGAGFTDYTDSWVAKSSTTVLHQITRLSPNTLSAAAILRGTTRIWAPADTADVGPQISAAASLSCVTPVQVYDFNSKSVKGVHWVSTTLGK